MVTGNCPELKYRTGYIYVTATIVRGAVTEVIGSGAAVGGKNKYRVNYQWLMIIVPIGKIETKLHYPSIRNCRALPFLLHSLSGKPSGFGIEQLTDGGADSKASIFEAYTIYALV